MIWIFLAVALVLIVYSSGFRKVVLWAAGSAVLLLLIGLMIDHS